MGALISLRGDGPWKGRSTRATLDRGDRRLRKLVNGYVSSDGHEIRQFPGWHTICDLTVDNNANGFERRVTDIRGPSFTTQPSSSTYGDWNLRGTPSEYFTQQVFSRVRHLHAFEQVRGRLILVGESDFRKAPIYGPTRNEVTIAHLYVNGGGPTGQWAIFFSQTPMQEASRDFESSAGTPLGGFNGFKKGDVVFVELDSVDNPFVSPAAFADLDNRFLLVGTPFNASGRSGFLVEHTTTIGGVITSPWAAVGRCWKTRNNRDDIYSPGVTPFEQSFLHAIDDPESLTTYTVSERLDLDNPCGLKTKIAYVANRMPDTQDGIPMSEGAPVTPSASRGISYRKKRSLPYRVVPEVAGNRLIMAAPGYSCVFQAPLIVPIDGEDYPSPTDWSPDGGQGIIHWFNDIYDKPRALGVPKAVLLESAYTPVPTTTPNVNVGASRAWWTPFYNFAVEADFSTTDGWPAGTYRIAISYSDDGTGEEGLASEEMQFTIPTNPGGAPAFTYQIALRFLHPGYLMGECLAMSMNVYLATNAVEPCAYYGTYPLGNDEPGSDNPSRYGSNAQYVQMRLPPPRNTSNISASRDEERLAPQSLQMPRGAECYRVIRGIGLGVGHSGTHGDSREILFARMSALYDVATPLLRTSENVLHVQPWTSPGVGTISSYGDDPGKVDGPFGCAANYFPPAYEGVGIHSQDLYPPPRTLAFVDKVINSRIKAGDDVTDVADSMMQRLQMTENIFDRDIGTPMTGRPLPWRERLKDAYMVLPRGQIQVSEPGRPEVATSVAIQFMDPNKDDDGLAIGNFEGHAIICSREETYYLQWTRAPRGNVPQQISTEHGCIAANTMAQFDGGLCWIGKRGPVAMTGGGLLWPGADLEHDFHGANARYAKDSRGMMRHAFAAHDSVRGLVYFGLVTTDATHQVDYKGVTATYADHSDAARSRFPCNEVLIWSYRANAFSTWVPPSGLEVYWMRSLRDNNGDERMCFLAADNRIYALDEDWSDTNRTLFTSSITGVGTATTTMVIADAFEMDATGASTARGTGENLVRTGMTVLIRDTDGTVVGKTTVASAVAATKTITLAAAQTWPINSTAEIGHRPDMQVITAFVGESYDNLDVESIQCRYTLHGDGTRAFAKVNAIKSDLRDGKTTLDYSELPAVWQDLGEADADAYGSRRSFAQGRSVAPECSVDITFTGEAHIRVTDLMLEVGGA